MGSFRNRLCLKDTLFVLDMELNLISCSALCLNGFDLRFVRLRCSVMKYRLLVVSTHMKGGLFPAEKRGEDVSFVNTARTARLDEDIWHARLGHGNHDSVMSLLFS